MSTTSKNHAWGGYSLLQLLVVLTIVSSLVVLATPVAMRSLDSARARADFQDLAAALRTARTIAVTQNQATAFGLNADTLEWAISGKRGGGSLDSGAIINMTVADISSVAGTGYIVFFPDGSSTGGSIELQSNGTSYAMEIDWLTGRIGFGED